jgi:hypothetical protein
MENPFIKQTSDAVTFQFNILFMCCHAKIPQWEHFIQKGGQNFFLFRFLLFGVKIMFSTILWDPSRFFGKIRPGQFLGKTQATALSSLHG